MPQPEKSRSCQLQHGFTLVEILIALAAIGLLAVLAVPAYHNYQTVKDIETAVNDIGDINIAITQYQTANNKLPKDLSEINMGDLRDPWGVPYQYFIHKNTSKIQRKDKNLRAINNDYDLYSIGKDGQTSPVLFEQYSLDDVVRANNGRWIGLGEKY
ncbi:MAG: type II secretion system protein [Gammaproteobacteria bacterium]